jgi:hypothetical protein
VLFQVMPWGCRDTPTTEVKAHISRGWGMAMLE